MSTRTFVPLLAALTLAHACETVLPPPPAELDLWDDASAGVSHAKLARLSEAVWDAELRADPFRATKLGDPRFHDAIPAVSRRARADRRDELEGLLRNAKAIVRDGLSEDDRLTHELLVQKLETDLARLSLGLEEWMVDPIAGPHIQILNLANVQPKKTPRERDQLVRRWQRLDSYVRQSGENLKYGLFDGKVASSKAVLKTSEQLEAILDVPPMDSPLVTIATGGGTWVPLPPGGNVAQVAHEHLGDARRQRELRKLNLHLQDGERLVIGTRVLLPADDDPLSPEERGKFLYAVLTAVEDDIYPALAGYKDVLRHQVLSRARSDEACGLVNVPGGAAAYRTLIHEHTTLPVEECDPRAIHDFGLAEVARIREEIAVLGERVLDTNDVALIQQRLRTDPDLHFATRDEVQAKATEALYNASGKLSQYFGMIPETECEVVRIAPHEEKDTTIAYYEPPAADGGRPGQYFINTYRPDTRPRYEAEVLAYHEALPGHHLQMAIAQELTDLPRFRRHAETTAFVEGWALYTERLCDEMGLYSGDLDRLGVLSFDAWRASRLVVDTGIHAFGWSRQQAIDYLYENTLLAKNNVENEVDRYIAWPGQALAYKIGQREILELRGLAMDELGEAFSYREFHDRILGNGAISLEALRGVIGRWLGTPMTDGETPGAG